jgi:hypothetical protein
VGIKVVFIIQLIYLDMLKKILYEPLVHFFILGLLVFVYFTYTSEDETVEQESITITPQQLEKLQNDFQTNYGYEITQEQVLALKKKLFYELVLLNEAYTLGLHEEDQQIRDRLLKKMQFVLTSQKAYKEPSEEELYKYYQKNIKRYSVVEELSFSHIFLKNQPEEKIDKLLQLIHIAKVKPKNARFWGDSFDLGNNISKIDPLKLEKVFGKYFSSNLLWLEKGKWHKLLHSKFGSHLVYIDEKQVGTPYTFDEVQGRVYLDYLQNSKESVENKAYEKLSSQYILKD